VKPEPPASASRCGIDTIALDRIARLVEDAPEE